MSDDAVQSRLDRWPLGAMVVIGFEPHALAPQFDVVRRLGASHVEFYPRWTNEPDPREAARAVCDAGLAVWSAHGPWGNEAWRAGRVDLASVSSRVRDASVDDVRRAIAWLAAAGGSRLVVHPGVLSEPLDEPARRAALVTSLNELAPFTEQHRVHVCVENMPPGCCPGSRMTDIASIVSDVSAPFVGLCLDTGHANIVADIASEARAAGSLLRTTHVHDNDGRRDQHLLPGLGTARWPEFSAALSEINYDGVVMLECPRFLREHPELITDETRDRLTALCRSPKMPPLSSGPE